MKNSSGFTLIEVLIAIAILAVLSMYTAQSIQSAVQNKAKITADLDRTSTLRDAIKIIERDIQLAFNYRDPNILLYNKAGQERERRAKQPATTPTNDQQPDASTPTPTAPTTEDRTTPVGDTEPFKPKNLVILTHFIGDEKSLHFTSLNNVRTQADSPVSDQMEVGYYIESCRNRVDPKISSQCLLRRTSSIIDNDVTKDGEAVTLLENVTRFEVRYLSHQENADWQTTWKSDASGDDVTKNHFPTAVEVTLETQTGKDPQKLKKTAMTIVAEIRNPNNPIPEQPQQPQAGGFPGAR